MKKVYYLSLSLLLLTITFTSCNNDDDQTVETNTVTTEVNVTLTAGEDYFYDVGTFGDEEGAGITTIPSNAEISEILYELDPDRYVYKYRAEAGFVGEDFVALTTAKGSDGSSPNPNIEVIEISITVISQ